MTEYSELGRTLDCLIVICLDSPIELWKITYSLQNGSQVYNHFTLTCLVCKIKHTTIWTQSISF